MNPGVQPCQSGGDDEHSRRLRTVSLRRRITVSVVGVLFAALVLSGVLVVSLFTAQSNRDARQQLLDREIVATQLDRRQVAAAQIARRVSGRGILARIALPGGAVVGPATGLDRSSNDQRRVRTTRLPSGAVLTLLHGNAEQDAATARLRELLIVVGAGTVGVTALVLLLTVRLALRPLDTMTSVAISIARGRRGRRLAPERSDTELGRTAAAFDEMLEALEGAEHAARQSEARTRRFVADAAHELRTPIAGVQSAAEILLHASSLDADTQDAYPQDIDTRAVEDRHGETRERMTALLVGEAQRVGRLVDDLLSLARIDAGLDLDMRSVDLRQLAYTELERMRLLVPAVRWRLEGEPVVVAGDAVRLGQVLTNLLDNARRHTPDGGDVLVRVAATGEHAELTVADSGPGIPAADRERVFDRMVRLDKSRALPSGGAGLGLAIARGIARAHGGQLTCVAPGSGCGATFRLTLPR